jgi:putative ubiquitin-RnfH superfamily antitoxin RatB of RatAB toxin-antitoxin module
MKRIYILTVGIVISSFLFTACGGGEKQESQEDDSTETEDPEVKKKIEHTQKIVYSVPSPSEMVHILEHAGATYNYKLLNDIKLVESYTSAKSRGINLGIYGADLNYANVFDNTQETMFYIQCTQKLAEALGIENAINESTVVRAQDNVDNKDSMINIISEMFWELHDYLDQNDKLDITAYIVVGGWVEGLFLATQTVNEAKPNKEIVQKVADLKLSLEHLIGLLNSYEKNESIDLMLADMYRFKEVYDKLEVKKSATSVKQEGETTVINGGTTISITMDQFKEIKALALEIRTNYVTPN